MIFVCVILIGVKSKYGSCNGSCTGLIKLDYFYISLYSSKVEQNIVNVPVECSSHSKG